MDSQFSPFTTPQSPALLMPPPSLPPPSLQPPSLPPPLTNERLSEASPHHSSSHHNIHLLLDMKPTTHSGGSMGHNPQSSQPSLSFPSSALLNPFNPMSVQGPNTPLNNIASVSDSHLQPTLQCVKITLKKNFNYYNLYMKLYQVNHFIEIL